MAATFDAAFERNHALGLAHRLRQESGLIVRDEETTLATTRRLIARLRAVGRVQDAQAIEAKLAAWCAVHVDPALDLIEEIEARAQGFARPEPAAVADDWKAKQG